MSFDLFIRRPGSSITEADLHQACSGVRWLDLNDENEIYYHHPDTQVSFHLSHEGDHVSFNMNMARPPYWGRQAMPVLMEVVHTLGAMVEDPQANDSEEVRVRNADELVESWEAANRFGLGALLSVFKQHQEAKMPHLRASVEQQTEWFEYMSTRWERIEKDPEVWCPRVHWVGAPQTSGELVAAQRMVVWNPRRPLLLPQVELVHLVGVGRDKVVSMKALMKILADEIFDASDDVPLWRCAALDFDGRTELATLEGRSPSELELRTPHVVVSL